MLKTNDNKFGLIFINKINMSEIKQKICFTNPFYDLFLMINNVYPFLVKETNNTKRLTHFFINFYYQIKKDKYTNFQSPQLQ